MKVHVPLVNQLATSDPNAREDCVPASVVALVEALTNRPYTVAAAKDATYGAGYVGAQAATLYVAWARAQGVDLFAADGAPAQLVASIRAQLAAGRPCLGTIPSEWAQPWTGNGSTHVVCFCDDDGANLTAMNPWGGFYHTQPYAWWQARLAFDEIWIGERMTTTTTTGAGEGFDAYAADPAHPITAPLDAYIKLDAEHAAAVYNDGTVLWWHAGEDVSASHAGTALLAVYAAWQQSEAHAAQLGKALAQAQQTAAQAPAPTPGEVEALAVIRALKVALAEVA